MTERPPSNNVEQTNDLVDSRFNAFAFSEEVRENPELMAEAVEDVGARVSDFIEQYPDIAFDPEFEGRHQYIQHALGNLAFIRDSIDDGRITGLKKAYIDRLDTLSEDAEDILVSMGDVDIDFHKDPVRQLERVFSEGHPVSESLAPDIAAEVIESSQFIRDITTDERVKMKGVSDYLSKKIAIAAGRAIEIPIHRDEWDKAA